MHIDLARAFSELAEDFARLASDAHKRRFDPLVRDVAYRTRQGGRLILAAIDAGLPAFQDCKRALDGWEYDSDEDRHAFYWVGGITFWLTQKYKARLPENAEQVDFMQWKRNPDVKPVYRKWTDEDGTKHEQWKLPEDGLIPDGSLFGQFKWDEADRIERIYQQLNVYVAVANLLAELADQQDKPLCPASPAAEMKADRPNLNRRERYIVEALGNKRMTGKKLAEAAGYPFHSGFKQTLAELTRRGVLVKRNDKDGRGYEVAKD